MEESTNKNRRGRRTAAEIEADAVVEAKRFNDAVASKVAELLPSLMAQLDGARAVAGTQNDPAVGGDRALLEGLAHAMAKASDPGNKRRIVSPEVMQQRDLAAENMRKLLIEFRAAGQVPVYRVVSKVFLAETLVDPQYQDPKTKEMRDQEVNWPKVPNQALEPINDEAKAVMKQFLLSISAMPRDTTNDPAPWVISNGELMRGKPGALRAQVDMVGGGTESMDPRRIDTRKTAQRKTINVLGSTAEPAVVNAY